MQTGAGIPADGFIGQTPSPRVNQFRPHNAYACTIGDERRDFPTVDGKHDVFSGGPDRQLSGHPGLDVARHTLALVLEQTEEIHGRSE